MSDIPTPRTDAAESNWWSEDGLRSAFIVRADFARELEREIARLTAERDEARQQVRDIIQRNEAQMLSIIQEGNGVARVLDCYCYKEETK